MGNVRRHIRVVHNGERNYQCSQCGRKFQQRSSLKTHTRTHEKHRKKHTKTTRGSEHKASTIYHPSKPDLLSCKRCDFKSDQETNIISHFKKVHKSGQENASNVISERTDRKILKTHKRKALQAEPTVLFPPNYNPTLQTNIITLQKPELFSCKECDYSSSKSNNVKLWLPWHFMPRQP